MTTTPDELKRQLLLGPAPRPVTDDTVEIRPGVVVRVRGITRGEMLQASALGDEARQEQMILARALVEPEMTEDEVAQWQQVRGASGDLQRVVQKVQRLSGYGT